MPASVRATRPRADDAHSFGARRRATKKAVGPMTAAALIRTTLTSVFVFLMLASAHLFMVVINAAETTVEPPRPSAGQPARMFSDQPLQSELNAALQKTGAADKRQV